MYNKLILTCKKRQEKMEWNDKMSMQCSKPKGKLGIRYCQKFYENL